ncbi:MAG: glycosyltransferase family 2 protein [Planctomycetota bacterium]
MIGGVAIGRNEGDRLVTCLRALTRDADHTVYVDSGSTDGSVERARSMGVEVVELDLSVPFTAARARNEGWRRLRAIAPDDSFVLFVDGDCEVVDGFVDDALEAMDADERLAAVCGRRRERYPGASLWNRLTDMEWDTPVGEAASCGGDAVIRVAALEQVGGYDPSVIAGEEPEMCFRMRAAGWRIRRINREMTLHDAALTRFGQWWKRCVRAGHAAAEGMAMHGRSPERFNVRRTLRPVFWAGLVPVLAVLLAVPTYGLSVLALVGLYGLQAARIWRRESMRRAPRDARVLAVFTVIGQFALLLGVWKYTWGRWRGRRSAIIEYKSSASSAG